MKEDKALLDMIPGPPDWNIPWEAFERTSLGSFFARMAETPQNPLYHGEGNVLAHTKLVCTALTESEVFRQLDLRGRQTVFLAGLLHDIGKISCTRSDGGVRISPHHAPVGAAMARELLWLHCGWCGAGWQTLRESICALIRYHALPVHAFRDGDGALRLRSVSANGEMLPDFTIERLCLLAQADIQGRICGDREELLEAVQLCEVLADESGCLTGPPAFPSRHTAFSYFSGRQVQPNHEIYDDTWGEVILLCGLPGTGKDTWIAQNCSGLPVVSLDDIRRELKISPKEPPGRVINEARSRARTLLREKRPFVWNATNVTAALRRKQVELFTAYHASTRIVYLETEWTEQLRRNHDRTAAVPQDVILRMLANLTPPERHEAHRVEWLCI